MPSKNKRTESERTLQFLRGGKPAPEKLVRQGISEVQQKKQAQFEQNSRTEQQMAKYLKRIQGVAQPNVDDPHRSKALDGLLGIHKRLTKNKLAAPHVLGGLGGILQGRISVKVTPPYDYDVILRTVLAGPEPTLSASADKYTGQMSVNCASSSERGFNGGSMYTTVGIYFHPLTAGTLTVQATPTYSYQWWTNSLQPVDLVRSFGEGALTVYGVDAATLATGESSPIIPVASQQFYSWEQDETGQVLVGFDSGLQTPVSVQAQVGPDLVYLAFVEAQAHVEGVGWPGSLSGAVLSVTVPSITYDFQMQEVLEPWG